MYKLTFKEYSDVQLGYTELGLQCVACRFSKISTSCKLNIWRGI